MKTTIVAAAALALFATGCGLSQAGDACFTDMDCAEGLSCNTDRNVCVVPSRPPADCGCSRADSNYTASPTYSAGASNSLKGYGASCTYNGECGGTLTCIDWTCQPRGAWMDSCREDDDCQSNRCGFYGTCD